MSVVGKLRAYNGIINWLDKNNIDIGEPKRKTYRARDEYLNNILIKFGREHNIKMQNNNSPKYKGSYSPVVSNAVLVQKNFGDFIKWIKINYEI